MTRPTPSAPSFVAVAMAALAIVWAGDAAGQELSPEERALAAWVDANVDEAVALLERTVNINSGTMNHEGVREVGRILEAELDALGFATEWIDMPPEVNRAGHLFARREGSQGRRLLLIGHLDTVFEEDDAFQRFERTDGDWATGPGINDMKSGNVIILYALKALEDAGLLDGAQITVAYTGDEESPGEPLSVSRGDLVAAEAAA